MTGVDSHNEYDSKLRLCQFCEVMLTQETKLILRSILGVELSK